MSGFKDALQALGGFWGEERAALFLKKVLSLHLESLKLSQCSLTKKGHTCSNLAKCISSELDVRHKTLCLPLPSLHYIT